MIDFGDFSSFIFYLKKTKLTKKKKKKKKKAAKFQQNPSQFCNTKSINRNKPNHTQDPKAITKFKISKSH